MSARVRSTRSELLARVERNVITALENAGIILEREIKRQLSKSSSPSAPGTPPGAVTGTLRRSVQIDRSQIARFRIRVGPGAKYARIQEYGGTILPRKGRALAVPIGGRRSTLQSIAAGRAGLRGLNLLYIKRRGRPPLLAEKGTRGSIRPLYVLVPSVTLAPRPYVRPAVRAVRQRILDQFSTRRLLRK